MITIYHFLLLAFVVFVIGFYGAVTSKGSIARIIIAFFVMQAGIAINFMAFAKYHGDIMGEVFYMLILAVGAAKIAVSLAIMLVCFRKHRTDGEEAV
ncbi:MAG: NADH-quinone oxidoreductase subunit K [Alphaproteobacteria bacterium]